MQESVNIRVRFPIDNDVLSDLHARAFGRRGDTVPPWASRLQRHSVTWVGAFAEHDVLVGYMHACWDGGVHLPARHSRRLCSPTSGAGQVLVQALIAEVTRGGCEWLHVDYEPHLDSFYRRACGFHATDAGLLHLSR